MILFMMNGVFKSRRCSRGRSRASGDLCIKLNFLQSTFQLWCFSDCARLSASCFPPVLLKWFPPTLPPVFRYQVCLQLFVLLAHLFLHLSVLFWSGRDLITELAGGRLTSPPAPPPLISPPPFPPSPSPPSSVLHLWSPWETPLDPRRSPEGRDSVHRSAAEILIGSQQVETWWWHHLCPGGRHVPI